MLRIFIIRRFFFPHLLGQVVAGQPDHLHAVLQGPRDRVQHVGRANEEALFFWS